MPAVPINRNNAWTYWSRGMIAATNIDDLSIESVDAKKIMGSLALKRGHNAIRLWFGYADPFTMLDDDITAVAQSPSGWADTRLLTDARGRATCTILSVAQQLTKVLDRCYSLGVGVVLVVNYGGGKLWDPSTGYANNLRQFWLKTYSVWGQHPALVGIDLLNEPTPPADALTFAQIKADPNSWPRLAQNIITDIRNHEQANGITTPLPLVVEGIYTGGTRSLDVFDDPTYTATTGPFVQDPKKRLVFSFHYYEPGCLTHQGVLEWDYESYGTTYPLPGVVQGSYWFNGQPNYVLRPYATPTDLQNSVQNAINFKAKFGVPIFVGEFSAAQARLDDVFPQMTPPRSQQLSSQRVSEIQNNVAWQAPLLNKLPSVRTQADFNALTLDERNSVYDLFNQTKRRWITKLVVGNDGYVTATIDHINVPTDALGTGFRVTTSPLTQAQLNAKYGTALAQPALADAGGQNWAVAGSPMNDDFYNQCNAKIIAGPGSVGAAFNMSSYALVKLVRHGYTIRFPAPAGSVAGTVLNGVSVNVPTGPGTTASVKMPVALLWYDAPQTTAQIDQSRFNYLRDVLSLWQTQGFSWAWFADGADDDGAVVCWRASQSMSELLATAATACQLAPRV